MTYIDYETCPACGNQIPYGSVCEDCEKSWNEAACRRT